MNHSIVLNFTPFLAFAEGTYKAILLLNGTPFSNDLQVGRVAVSVPGTTAGIGYDQSLR